MYIWDNLQQFIILEMGSIMFTYILAGLLIFHGLVHILGFLIFFEFIEVDTLQYSTTVLGGRVNIGAAGIRILGVIWLLIMIAMMAAGVGLLLGTSWWYSLALWSTVASTVVTILGLPDTKFGLAINILVFILLFLGSSQGWY